MSGREDELSAGCESTCVPMSHGLGRGVPMVM